MRLIDTDTFRENLLRFPELIRKKFYKQAKFLLENLRHPSLRAKKYDEPRDIWQARVDRNVRFYFLIEGDTYILLDIKQHPK